MVDMIIDPATLPKDVDLFLGTACHASLTEGKVIDHTDLKLTAVAVILNHANPDVKPFRLNEASDPEMIPK